MMHCETSLSNPKEVQPAAADSLKLFVHESSLN
jgi:hypothetical protein